MENYNNTEWSNLNDRFSSYLLTGYFSLTPFFGASDLLLVAIPLIFSIISVITYWRRYLAFYFFLANDLTSPIRHNDALASDFQFAVMYPIQLLQ